MEQIQQRYDERRRHERFAVVGTVKGLLVNSVGEQLIFIVSDVSQKGLGLVISMQCKAGDILSFSDEVGKVGTIYLRVAWCTKASEKPDSIYRCGLESTDQEIDLEQMLRSQPNIQLENLG